MSYEAAVHKQRVENRRILRSLGIPNLREELAENIEQKKPRFLENSIRKSYKKPSLSVPSRKSARLIGKKTPKYAEIENMIDAMNVRKFSPKKVIQPPSGKRENIFGAIPGVPVGTEYSTRLEASYDGIHRPTVAGIHGNPSLGCYSISLSGGYEDDVDNGDSFVYTGEGGRDLKGTKAKPKNLRTAAQSKDQVLARGNLALTRNIENNTPVRVLRGFKLKSIYAPMEGYRYDGLYRVVKYYLATGKSGFEVYKFLFERLEDQDPAPWADKS